MSKKFSFALFATLLLTVSAWADAPTLLPGSVSGLREQDIVSLFVRAEDPENDPLTYRWTIVSDPTGNAFFRVSDGSEPTEFDGSSGARLALRGGPSFPEPSFEGSQIQVSVEVSDGESSTSHTFVVPVSGVNLPPVVVVDASGMGTHDRPRLTDQGIGLDATASYDPDSDNVKFLWQIVGISGGRTCETALVLFGKETPTPGLPVPLVSAKPAAPMSISFEYRVEDGLHLLVGVYLGYMASENGCNGNTPPLVSASAVPSPAEFGEEVHLIGSATDPGDQLSYSWVQLSTSSDPTVSLSGADSTEASFVAPNVEATLHFRFTATDSRNQAASADVAVEVRAPDTGPGDGGGEPDPPAEGPTAVLRYKLQGENELREVPADALPLTSPATVILDAESSRVTGSASYEFRLESDLQGGTAQLVQTGSRTRQLQIRNRAYGSVSVILTVSDETGLSDGAQVHFEINAPNEPPRARLHYRVVENESLREASDGESIEVDSPADILLDASESTDEDSLDYSFTLEEDLISGGAVLTSQGEAQRVLQLQAGTRGSLQVTCTVTDRYGASDSLTLLLEVNDAQRIPRAYFSVWVGDRLWPSGEPVKEDRVVVLDGSDSQLPDGEKPEGMTFSWKQTAGSPVALMGADMAVARFRVPELEDGPGVLGFELTVGFDGQQSPVEGVEIPVEVAPLLFSQVAFGPFLDQRFRTVLLLINDHDSDVDAQVELYDQQGQPLDVELEGEPGWSPDQALPIDAGGSRRLRFSPRERDRTTVGWARVSSRLGLTGLVLYQLLDGESGDVESEVSLFSSPAAETHRTFFDPAYESAAALLNPGAEPIPVRFLLIDPDHGPESPLASKVVTLDPSHQSAFFLDESFFGDLGGLLPTATLVVQSSGNSVAITILKTRGGVAISSLPLATR